MMLPPVITSIALMFTLMLGLPAVSVTEPLTLKPLWSAAVGSVMFPGIETEGAASARYGVPAGGP